MGFPSISMLLDAYCTRMMVVGKLFIIVCKRSKIGSVSGLHLRFAGRFIFKES